jgi:hypothetical protein
VFGVRNSEGHRSLSDGIGSGHCHSFRSTAWTECGMQTPCTPDRQKA